MSCLRVLLFAVVAVYPVCNLAEESINRSNSPLEIHITSGVTESAVNRTETTTTISSQQLEESSIQSTEQLQYLVPGYVFRSSAGLNEPYLRGIGGLVASGGDSGVATFVDGVYQKRSVRGLQDFYDIDYVDVMKGPHNVRLGRNVIGGAVSIQTRDPDQYRASLAELSLGDYSQRQLKGMLNMPFGDKVAARFAVMSASHDGYSDNVYRDKELDDQENYAWRAKLAYSPIHDVNLVFSAENTHQDDTRGFSRHIDANSGVNSSLALGGTAPSDPREVSRNVDEQQEIDGALYHLRGEWLFDRVKLRSITAYQRTEVAQVIDLDGTEINTVESYPKTHSTTWSQELRLSSLGKDALSWSVGAYWLEEDARQQLDVKFPTVFIQNLSQSETTHSVYSLFGELGYVLSSRWRSHLGLRYSNEYRTINLQTHLSDPFGIYGMAGTFEANDKQKQDWHTFTPEFGLVFQQSEDARYFANLTRGFKSGGYNALSIQPAYDPEYLWAYEVGSQVQSLNRRLTSEVSVFYYDYRDMQILTLDPDAPVGSFPVVENAAKAEVKGVDLQMRFRADNQLATTLSMTVLDAEFNEYLSVDPNNPSQSADQSGKQLPQAPQFSAALAMDYVWFAESGAVIKVAGNYKYQSEVYFNPYEDEAVRQGGYSLLNASLHYELPKSHWYVDLYGRNLTDKLYAQNIIRSDPIIGTIRYWGEPRTVGFRLGYRI